MTKKPVTLCELLDYTASRFPTNEAYMWIEDGRIASKTYVELRDDAARMAERMRRRFGTNKKIAIIGDMSYSWICAYYGIMNSANVSVPLDTKLSPEELVERLIFADVSVVFLSEKYAPVEDAIRAMCGKVEAVLALEECLADSADVPLCNCEPMDPDALSSLMFTSGTSGDGLKAAMITQRAILADVTGYVPLCVPGDRLLSLLPVHHCFEIFVGQMKYQYLGATICINDSMANLIPNLTRFGITIVVAVPALANMLAAFIAQGLKSHTLDEVKGMLGGRLRRITIGGASASREVIDTLGLAGITVFVGYGLTESTGGCLANCDASIRPREAGAPYVEGMEMKLEDGELCLRGPMIMQGYYKAPELTAKVMEDGWFHTGDLAEITDEGYVIILGRKDNMIKTPNGEKIYPETWENWLSNIADVSAAMVADVDHHLTAVVFLKEDSPERRSAVIEAIDGINTRLPNYQKILDVRFREKPFPMTTSLKIKRAVVMKELSGQSGTIRTFTPPQDDRQRQILAQVIKVLPDNSPIGTDDNLFELGLDSLSTINLAILLDCDPEAVYSCKTIRRLSERLAHGDAGRALDHATKVEGINRFIGIMPPMRAGLGQTVLLTGASGFLGAHLLDELTRLGRNVICLVRSEAALDEALWHYGFSKGDRDMEVVIGDITKERLGLSVAQYDGLCARANAVVHAAALVSHVGCEEASYRVNVEGTREILRFCKKSGAALFHISSYAVAGFKTDVPLAEKVLDIGQEIGWNPYIQTKYQAEEQVLLARGDGVPSTIFRVGNLTARASDGRFQINADASGMAAQLRAIRKLGVYPRSMRDVPYDHTAVDSAAKAITLLAERNGTGYIWHIMNPNVLHLEQLTEARMIDDAAFARQLAGGSADRDVSILSVYYRMKQNDFNVRFDSERTQNELARLGFSWET